MITIVDYGLGNVQAIANIYKRLEIPTKLAKSAADLDDSSHLILPGVGAFDWAMSKLEDSGMRPTLEKLVIEQDKPVLGICVGLQMMAKSSEEGTAQGLGWFDATVKLFEPADSVRTPLPHMGWNDVELVKSNGLLRQLGDSPQFYFLHSYYFAQNVSDDVIAWSDYAVRFACALSKKNIHGVQFHPEKSHGWGVQLLKNFASL